MGLFDKYFGSGDTKKDESQTSNSEIIKEYEQKVRQVAWNYFFFEDRLFQTDRFDYDKTLILKRNNLIEYDRLFLVENEPRTISLIIFGYYVLNDLGYSQKCNGSLISLFDNSELYKRIILNITSAIAQNRFELVNVMARKLGITIDDPNDYAHKTAIATRFLFHRFGLYSQLVFNGLKEVIANPDISQSTFFENALNYYSNPHIDNPKMPNEDICPKHSFGDYIKRSYIYLKDGIE